MLDLNSCNVEFFEKLTREEPHAFVDKEVLMYNGFDMPYT